MTLSKYIAILSLLLVSFSCSILKKNNNNGGVDTKGKYEIINRKKITTTENNLALVSGHVFDEHSKKAISYGYVIAKNQEDIKTTIDSTGHFQLSLPSGSYEFKISSVGNKDLTTNSIVIQSNEEVVMNVYLGTSIIYETKQ